MSSKIKKKSLAVAKTNAKKPKLIYFEILKFSYNVNFIVINRKLSLDTVYMLM